MEREAADIIPNSSFFGFFPEMGKFSKIIKSFLQVRTNLWVIADFLKKPVAIPNYPWKDGAFPKSFSKVDDDRANGSGDAFKYKVHGRRNNEQQTFTWPVPYSCSDRPVSRADSDAQYRVYAI